MLPPHPLCISHFTPYEMMWDAPTMVCDQRMSPAYLKPQTAHTLNPGEVGDAHDELVLQTHIDT
jgi:hypothetical protein